jgi:hypothetical protein
MSGAASGLCRPLHIVAQSSSRAWLKKFRVTLLALEQVTLEIAPEPARSVRKYKSGAAGIVPVLYIVAQSTSAPG